MLDEKTQVLSSLADKSNAMAQPNQLIFNLLRIITPEEIGEITTKHNGGKFLSLTSLVKERVEKNIARDFSKPIEEEGKTAKILPFSREEMLADGESEGQLSEDSEILIDPEHIKDSLSKLAHSMNKDRVDKEKTIHNQDENMSSFIMIEKARLKKSQQSLKQKEILDLYRKTSNVDVEQMKGQGENLSQSRELGVLVNKKQY
jgi:hypothetical protein